MTRRTQSVPAVLALWGLYLVTLLPGSAQKRQYVGGIPGATTGRVTAVVLGTIGVTAGITFGVYEAVKHAHTVTGCARAGPDGLQLTSESDRQTYSLIGEVVAIKPGERVRVSGKANKAKSPGTSEFLVEKISKHLGPCAVTGAAG